MSKEDNFSIFAAIVVGFIWVLSALTSLGLIGAIIWAIVTVVQHYT